MIYLKAAILAVLVAAVAAFPSPPYGGAAPIQYVAAPTRYVEEPYEERNYKVYYSVKDDPSYNYQTRNEEKNGNTVTGQYTVLEPTGELRVVNYIADEYGFRADVQNQPNYGPSAPAAVHGPVVNGPSYGRVQVVAPAYQGAQGRGY